MLAVAIRQKERKLNLESYKEGIFNMVSKEEGVGAWW